MALQHGLKRFKFIWPKKSHTDVKLYMAYQIRYFNYKLFGIYKSIVHNVNKFGSNWFKYIKNTVAQQLLDGVDAKSTPC